MNQQQFLNRDFMQQVSILLFVKYQVFAAERHNLHFSKMHEKPKALMITLLSMKNGNKGISCK